jgi:hypothetical protein
MSRLLEEIRVAAPCGVSWDDMIGSNRVRYCHHCRLSVYNLSALGREEAEAMVQQREGPLCVRFYRRADGTMITQDCPVGVQGTRWALQRGWVLLTACLVGVLAAFIGVSLAATSGRMATSPFASMFEFLFPSDPVPDAVPLAAPVKPELPLCVMGEMALPPVSNSLAAPPNH